MTNNTYIDAYAMLSAYFQYQRDIGVDELIFARGSGVMGMLSGGTRALATQPQTPLQRTGGAAASGQRAAAAGPPTLSKLSKLSPVGELGLGRIERNSPPPKINSAKREKLAELYREVLGCDKCALSRSRIKVVFGAGDADARLFVIGGAPSPQDEEAGRPFQGDAGDLFEKILGKMGLDRGAGVFTAHLQKCFNAGGYEGYDGGGDGLDAGYAHACKATLDRQIDVIEPKAVLIFGQQTANFLLGNDDNIEKLRGANYIYNKRPAVVTYDLPLLLRETQYRHGAWEDMKKVLELVR